MQLTREQMAAAVGKRVRITNRALAEWENMPPGDDITTILRNQGGYFIVAKPEEFGGYTGTWKGFGWGVSQACLEFVDPDLQVKPYPTTCTKCNSPARRVRKLTVCSSSSCRANKKVKSIVGKSPKASRLADELGFVLCPECGAKGIAAYRCEEPRPRFQVVCSNHSWIHRFEYGQAIDVFPGGQDKHDVYVYTGQEYFTPTPYNQLPVRKP